MERLYPYTLDYKLPV